MPGTESFRRRAATTSIAHSARNRAAIDRPAVTGTAIHSHIKMRIDSLKGSPLLPSWCHAPPHGAKVPFRSQELLLESGVVEKLIPRGIGADRRLGIKRQMEWFSR